MSQASSDDTTIVAELKLQDRLTALRNVRPGTQLARLEDVLAWELLQELLGLPEGVNALRWLAAERGAAVALLTLKRTLNLAEGMYGSNRDIASVDLPPPFSRKSVRESRHQEWQEKYGGLYGPLLTADGGWTAPKQAIHSSDDVSARRCLVGALRELRRQSGLPTEDSPERSRVDPGVGTLLADLLRLPDDVDPVQWLQDNRPTLCALLTLQGILWGAIPKEPMKDLSSLIYPSFKLGEPPRALSPRSLSPAARVRTGDRLQATLTKIDLLEQGFVVYVECRFGVPPDGPFMDNPLTGPTVIWEGFRSVRDSAGHHYVVVALPQAQSTNSPRWWQGKVAHACWPALGEARELILESQPAYLAVHRRPREGDTRVHLPGPSLGNARCAVALDI